MAPASLPIQITNNTSSPSLHASITGTHPTAGLFLLSSDGKTPYHPTSPSSTLTPPTVDVSIPIGGPGASRTLTIPRLSGGRIWLSTSGKGVSFLINPGPALVEPSVMNPSDANYEEDWGFAEFTLNEQQLYVNVSYVDFVSLPVSLALSTGARPEEFRTVPGMPADGLARVAEGLEKQGQGWEKMVIRKKEDNSVLRVLSPNSGAVLFPGIWDGYYKQYVDEVWKKYEKETLIVNTQFTWGDVKGKVKNGKLEFKSADGKTSFSFAKPSALDIFSCSTGPFAHTPDATEEKLNVGARLAAAFNRSTLLKNKRQPEGERVKSYYKPGQGRATNWYGRVTHEVSVQGRGYAFPYDDVGPSDAGEEGEQSGFLNSEDPGLLKISVGKPME